MKLVMLVDRSSKNFVVHHTIDEKHTLCNRAITNRHQFVRVAMDISRHRRCV